MSEKACAASRPPLLPCRRLRHSPCIPRGWGHSHPIAPRQGDAITTTITPLPKRPHHRVMGTWLVVGHRRDAPWKQTYRPGQRPRPDVCPQRGVPRELSPGPLERQAPWRRGGLSSWTPAAAPGKREADRWAARTQSWRLHRCRWPAKRPRTLRMLPMLGMSARQWNVCLPSHVLQTFSWPCTPSL